jgi:NADH-quinone oxidoreductase subunit E
MTQVLTNVITKTKDICGGYPLNESSLIEVLHDITSEFNYLPEDAIKEASQLLNVPIAKVYAVATFYKGFSLEPRGKNIIKVCKGTTCHVRGTDRNLDEFKRCMGLEPGQTTEDMKYTLEIVNCVGACAMAPVIAVNGKYYGSAGPETVHEILGLKSGSDTNAATDKVVEDEN